MAESNTAHPLAELERQFWDHADQLEDGMDRQLSGELKLVVPAKVTRSLYGFSFDEDDEVKAEKSRKRLERRKEAAARFRSGASHFRDRLSEVGVEPIAVLPRAIWQSLCEEAGMYRFEQLDSAGLAPSENPFPLLMSRAIKFIALLMLVASSAALMGGSALPAGVGMLYVTALFFAARRPEEWALAKLAKNGPQFVEFATFMVVYALYGAPASYFLCKAVTKRGAVWSAGDVAAAALFAFIFGFLAWGIAAFTNHKCRGLQPRFAALCIKVLPKKRMLKMLWPEAIDDKNGSHRLKVSVRFPSPPADVVKTLKAVTGGKQGWQVRVASVPEAISIYGGDIAESVRRANEEEDRRRREAVAKDPIVYLVSGDLVAVIAQYGELAIEQRVIEKVSKLDYLPA